MSNLSWNHPLVQFGVGAFETMRCTQGQIPLAEAHKKRISQALIHWGLDLSLLESHWNQLLKEAGETQGEFRFKILLGLDDRDQLISHIFKSPYVSIQNARSLRLTPQYTFLPQTFKSSSYEGHFWARRQAISHGADDALYHDASKNLLECSTAALLEWKDGIFWAVDGPVLASVSVQVLSDRFPKMLKFTPSLKSGNWSERTLLTCNALHGLLPVGQIIQNDNLVAKCSAMDPSSLQFWNQQLFNPIQT